MEYRPVAEAEVDFSGDSEGLTPDSHLEKRFPVTSVGPEEIELDKAA